MNDKEREEAKSKAYELWKAAGADKAPQGTLKKISEEIDIPEGTIRRWKSQKWMPEQLANVRANVQSKNASIKWEDLKRDFMCNEYKDLREFAEAHNLVYGTGSFIKKTTGWISEKKERRREVNEKVIIQTEKEIEDELTKLNKRHIDISTKILDSADKAIAELNKYVVKLRTGYGKEGYDENYIVEDLEAIDVDKLLKITKSLAEVQKIQRTAVGITDNPDKGKKIGEQIKSEIKDMTDEELRRLADEYR